MMRAALCVALFAAGSAAAQNPPDAKPQEPPPERPRLNLRLDNPSSFATIAPADKGEQKPLPTLGGDARKIEATSGTAGAKSEGGPYPKDTNPNN
jgi:hypothetical protein